MGLRGLGGKKKTALKNGGRGCVLRTGSMEHPPISSTPILKFSSNLGKIGPKKMLGGVVLPPGTLFSPGASFSQWAST